MQGLQRSPADDRRCGAARLGMRLALPLEARSGVGHSQVARSRIADRRPGPRESRTATRHRRNLRLHRQLPEPRPARVRRQSIQPDLLRVHHAGVDHRDARGGADAVRQLRRCRCAVRRQHLLRRRLQHRHRPAKLRRMTNPPLLRRCPHACRCCRGPRRNGRVAAGGGVACVHPRCRHRRQQGPDRRSTLRFLQSRPRPRFRTSRLPRNYPRPALAAPRSARRAGPWRLRAYAPVRRARSRRTAER